MALAFPDLAPALVEAALKAGADAADAMAISHADISVGVRGGELERAERAESAEFGVRVLVGGRQACVSASDPRPETIATLAARAIAMAREAPEDPWCGLAAPEDIAADRDAGPLELIDPDGPPDAAALEALALRVEAGAASVEGVAQVDGASAGWRRSEIALAASNGFAGGYARTSSDIGASVIAGTGTGMETDYDYASRRRAADLPDPESVGRRAAERAVAALAPRKPPTGAFPVLYDERVSASLIGHALEAANGASVARGSSWLSERMGERILPAGFDVVETPHRKRGGASRPFDHEGLPTKRAAIFEDGALMRWLLDLATARQLGLSSTANASRGPASAPRPSAGEVETTLGDVDRAGLIAEMGRGLLITSLIGRSVNPNTGAYSRGASGFWVEGGEIAYPVNELTIAGALPEMLASLRPANDADPWSARRIPSLLVHGLTVAAGG